MTSLDDKRYFSTICCDEVVLSNSSILINANDVSAMFKSNSFLKLILSL